MLFRSTTALRSAFASGWDLPTAIREAVKTFSAAEGHDIEAASLEAGVLDRTRTHRRKFRRLDDDEVSASLAG